MFKRLYTHILLLITRISLRPLVKKKDSKLKKKKGYKQLNDIMEAIQKNLIENKQLNDDLTEGPVPPKIKSAKELVSSFVSLRNKQQEDDFNLQVAREWLGDFVRLNHKKSIIFIIIFLAIYASMILFSQYISGITGLSLLLGMLISPLIGFFYALKGKGWKKWVLAAINIFLIYIFITIVT